MTDEKAYAVSVSGTFALRQEYARHTGYEPRPTQLMALSGIPVNANTIEPKPPPAQHNPLAPWLALPIAERQKTGKPVLESMLSAGVENILDDIANFELDRAASRIGVMRWCGETIAAELPDLEFAELASLSAYEGVLNKYNEAIPLLLAELEKHQLAREKAQKLEALRQQRARLHASALRNGPPVIALPNSFPESWIVAWDEGRIMGLGTATRQAPYRVGRYEWLKSGLRGALIGMWPERLDTLNPTLVVDTGQAHLTTIMPTRQGKSACHVIPNVLAYQGSCVVVDTKGAIFEATAEALRAKGRHVYRLSPFEPNSPDKYNPFHHIGLHQGFEERARAFVETLLERDGLSGDGKFWQQKGSAAIFAMLLYVLQSPEASLCNMQGLKRFADNPKGLLDTAEQLAERIQDGNLISNWAERIIADADSWEKLAAIAGQEVVSILEPWFSETVLKATSESTIDPRSMMADRASEGQFTLFIDLPSNRADYYRPVIRGMLATLFDAIKAAPKDPTQLPVLFLLDEFANYGYVKTFATALREAAGYGIRIWTFLQGRQDLQRTYPDEWKSFVDNATVIIWCER